MKSGFALFCALLIPNLLGAQRLSTVIVGDGWEAFRGVEYIGGDGALRDKKLGAIVITDSSVAFHQCQNSGCYEEKGKPPFKGPPILFIPLKAITQIAASDKVRGNAIMLESKDRTEEFVSVAYETDKSAEAPVFETQQAQSLAIVAKINFRRKKLGLKVDGH